MRKFKVLEKKDYSNLGKDEIRDMIKEAGIIGLGGAGFPVHVKLTLRTMIKLIIL